jgi:fermentation-respiration switch protein FrsA (DUF1100 family)
MSSGALRAWPAAAGMRGLIAEPAGPVKGTAIVFHGNAGHAGDRGYYSDMLVPLGWRVVLAEYPGYGARPGRPSESALVDDAVATVELARQRFAGPLLLIGESLGAGVASAAFARRRDAVTGLVLITPWDRLDRLAAHHYPWLPVRLLLRDRYDNVAALRALGKPLTIVVAQHDRIVPPGFGQALHAALGEPKRLVVIPSAGHNDWPARIDGRWWLDVLGFGWADAP